MNALDLVRAAVEPVSTLDKLEQRKRNRAAWGQLVFTLQHKPAAATVHGTKLVLKPLGSTDMLFMYMNDPEESRNVVAMYVLENTVHGFNGDEICVDPTTSHDYDHLALPASLTPGSILRVIFADAAKRLQSHKATAAAEPDTAVKSAELLAQALKQVNKRLVILRNSTIETSEVKLTPSYVDTNGPLAVYFALNADSENRTHSSSYAVRVRGNRYRLDGRDGYGTLLELPAATTPPAAVRAAVEILKAAAEHWTRVNLSGYKYFVRRRDTNALAAAEPPASGHAAFVRAFRAVRAALAKEPKRERIIEAPRSNGTYRVRVRLAKPRFGTRGATLADEGIICLETVGGFASRYAAYVVEMVRGITGEPVINFQVKGRKAADLNDSSLPSRPAEVLGFLAKLFMEQLMGPDKAQASVGLTAAAEPSAVRNVLATMPETSRRIEKPPLTISFARLSGNAAGEGTQMLLSVQDSRYFENLNVVPDVFFKVSLGSDDAYVLTSTRVTVTKIPATLVRSYQQLVNLVVPYAIKYAARLLASRANKAAGRSDAERD